MGLYLSHSSALEYLLSAAYREPSQPGRALRVQAVRNLSRRRAMDADAVSDVAVRGLLGGRLSHLHVPLRAIAPRAAQRRQSATLCTSLWGTPLPSRAFLEIGEGVCVSTPEFAFVQMAAQLDLISLVELGCELCGTYSCGVGLPGMHVPTSYDYKALTSVERLSQCVGEVEGAPGIKRAREALAFVAQGAASPMETRLIMAMALPGRLGGYGMGVPCPNYVVEASSQAREMAGRAFFRCDLYLPAGQLDIEYNGRQFHRGQREMERDARRANALLAMGIKTVTVTADQLRSERGVDALMRSIARQAGVRVRSRARGVEPRRRELLRRLFGHLWGRG